MGHWASEVAHCGHVARETAGNEGRGSGAQRAAVAAVEVGGQGAARLVAEGGADGGILAVVLAGGLRERG